jgi:hypothetical protein
MTNAQRRTTLVLRWASLPLAMLCLGGPLWSLASVSQHYEGKVITEARVLSATVRRAGAKGIGTSYDAYVRYTAGNRTLHSNISVTVSFRSLGPGDNIRLFVDPRTGSAEDDIRPDSWAMVAMGAVAAAFFVLVGFRYLGTVLGKDAAISPTRS